MKTILLFAGLPYTGKTTLIRTTARLLSGAEIHADEVFNRRVPPAERSLKRWLEEGPELVRGIIDRIDRDPAAHTFVEVGIMRRADRDALIRWARTRGYRIVAILTVCHDEEEVLRRFRARQTGPEDEATIRITLGELYERIRAAFETPTPAEGYLRVDTTRSLETCAAHIAGAVAEREED